MTRETRETRARIAEHWKASELGDTDAEHAIYAADAILEYPQSGVAPGSRRNVAGTRPSAISPSAASWAVATSGSASA
jgi:hypothetical protein